MKRIRTSKPVGLPRFIYAPVVCALVATSLGVGSGIAADENAKVTLVSEHALPNVPGKSMRAVLVEYGPGAGSPSHGILSRHSSTQPCSKERSEESEQCAERTYQAGESCTERPGDRHQVSQNASTTAPAKLLAMFVVDTSELRS